MRKPLPVVQLAFVTLVALSLGSAPAPAQQLTDGVVIMVYLDVTPQSTAEWLGLFKKHFVPALEELKQQGALRVYHLFVPSLHHPNQSYTHVLALAYKDRAGQAVAEKKFQEVFAAVPPAEAQKFQGAIDLSKHFDNEWREIDLAKVPAPEEKKVEEKKPDEKK